MIKVQSELASRKGCLPGLQTATFSLCPRMAFLLGTHRELLVVPSS